MTVLRIILDTNVLVSGIAYPSSIPGKIMAAWRAGSIEMLLSNYILDELRIVLLRLGHRHNLSPGEIDDLVDIPTIQADLLLIPTRTQMPNYVTAPTRQSSVRYARARRLSAWIT